MTTEPATASRSATILSEVLGPAPLLSVLFLEAGLESGSGGWWALLPILGIATIPYCALILLARRGRVSDRFVGERRQRLPILLGILVCIGIVLAVLALADAPTPIVTASIAAAIGLVVVMVANAVWKLSIHMAIVMFFALYQFIALPPWAAMVLVIALPLTLGWARIAARAHTLAQVIAGAAAGALVFVVYLFIR